jgi:hypothetical protein
MTHHKEPAETTNFDTKYSCSDCRHARVFNGIKVCASPETCKGSVETVLIMKTCREANQFGNCKKFEGRK